MLYFYTSGFNHAAMKYDPNYRFSRVEKFSVAMWIGNRPVKITNAIEPFVSSLAFLFLIQRSSNYLSVGLSSVGKPSL